MDTQDDVRQFLASRRARLTPDKAGLPSFGGTRRVPGLRRAEVALLAGITCDYYSRLERGMMFQSQSFVRALRAQQRAGTIVNLASIGGYKPNIDFETYDASKGGVVMLTKSLALNLAKFNIRVNGIAPGLIRTPGVDAMDDSSTENVKQITSHIAMRRLGEPDDIAKVAFFLASDAASYMTGSIVVVDGGTLID
ncbi:SDR family oxidoreductase [Actinoplanes sp. NPDC051411]|uniref:SDR family oxidoreductase n=1 Tax=Actinoplanes sp. NPDC051411 TaxID=3155522 RepID=UPI00342493FA